MWWLPKWLWRRSFPEGSCRRRWALRAYACSLLPVCSLCFGLFIQLLCSPLPLLDRVLSLQNCKPKDTLHATKSLSHSVLSPQEKSNWYNQLIWHSPWIPGGLECLVPCLFFLSFLCPSWFYSFDFSPTAIIILNRVCPVHILLIICLVGFFFFFEIWCWVSQGGFKLTQQPRMAYFYLSNAVITGIFTPLGSCNARSGIQGFMNAKHSPHRIMSLACYPYSLFRVCVVCVCVLCVCVWTHAYYAIWYIFKYR